MTLAGVDLQEFFRFVRDNKLSFMNVESAEILRRMKKRAHSTNVNLATALSCSKAQCCGTAAMHAKRVTLVIPLDRAPIERGRK